jgi:exopolyphosphatase/guanosine-5'-triphosphate,3'-diphosphate pyrophosphatase
VDHRLKKPFPAGPVAVIDIGSNSIRLVVYERAARSPAQLFNEKLLCALGRRLASTGRLDASAMERAYAGLRRFRRIAEQAGARHFYVIATAAARDAENGPEFIEKARKLVGLDIKVLNGEEEAEYAAAGIAAGFLDPDGIAGDLGGGSLELVDILGGEVRHARSLQLGGLALIDKSGGSMAKAKDIIDRGLDKAPWLEEGRGRAFYPIGGTWRTLARIHMNLHNHPLNIIHGYSMTPEDVSEMANVVMSRPMSALEKLAEAVSERAEVLPFGALVLKRVVERVKPSGVLVSAFGVREGLIYKLLPDTASASAIRCWRRARKWRCSARVRLSMRASCAAGPMRCSASRGRRSRRRSGVCAMPPVCCPTSLGRAIPTIAASTAPA